MADVQALDMDVVTEKSGHNVVGMAVSVCLTPAAPAPLPIPYPLTASVAEGITDSPLRTKVSGTNCATIGSVLKTCHGNEPGSLKEVVSLNQMGPVAPITGAFTVLIELGPAAFTGSIADMNKAPTPGVGSNASDAGGAGGGGGAGAGGPGAGGGDGSPNGPGGGGGGSGGSGDGAAGTAESPHDEHTCQGGHPVDLVTGFVVDKATDLDIPGLIPLVFKRYYSSARHEDGESSLGPGWAHSFDQRIVPRDRSIALKDGEGRHIYFEKVGVGQSSFHRRERMTLTRSGELEFRVYSHELRRTSVFSPVLKDGPAVIRRIEDNYGNAIVFEYRKDRLARVIDTAGRSVNIAWRGELISSLSVAAGGSGFVVSYEYARNGCLAAVRNPLGHVETYKYDTLRRMVSTTTLSGTPFVYEYDGESPRCVATYGPDGLYEVHIQRDPETKVTFADGEEPRVLVWNELGLVERLTLPDGTVLDEVAYDKDGYVIARANGAGEGYQYWYDERGNRIRELDACQELTAYEYAGDRLVRVVESGGLVTQFSYDERGSATGVEYPWGEAQFREYDTRGRLTKTTGISGPFAIYEYDERNNVVAETDARGARTTFRYDGMGRPISMRDALGRVTNATFDALGRRTSLTLPDGATTQFSYDAAGHLSRVVDALGRVTQYKYTGFRALSQVIGADGQSWKLKHSKEERILQIINPLGEVYSCDRDLAGRVVAEEMFDGRRLQYQRNAAGRVAQIAHPDGTRALAYDRMGRVVGDATAEDAISLQRDAFGRIVAAVRDSGSARHETILERDPFGSLIGEKQEGRHVRYEVDVLGRRTRRVLPNGATSQYGYDSSGALCEVVHDGFRLELERDVLGRETSRAGAAGLKIQRRYDAVDRLIEQSVVAPGPDANVPQVVVDRRWTYDRIGRVERLEDGRWGPTQYRHDELDQLVEVRRVARLDVFEYDAAGSIISALEAMGGVRRATTETLAPGNVLVAAGSSKYTYDDRGRRTAKILDDVGTTTYSWDGRDALREATLPDGSRVRLSYDALGRRIRKDNKPAGAGPVRATEYMWDGDVLAMEVDSVAGPRVFVHEPDTFLPLLQQERGEVFAYILDHVGTARELVDSAGRVVWSVAASAWGADPLEGDASARGGVTSPFRLLGQIVDSDLDLRFTRHRLFDAAVARWLTPDPFGILGGLNAYAFDGSPIVVVDPWGLATTAASGTAHPTGSYQIKFKSGKTYDGKGPASRMEVSAKERSAANNDPVVSKVWTPAANRRDAFKQESRNMDANGGPGSPNNYNEIESPGKKYRVQDGEIPPPPQP
jgi:RHS repeat-associated protein